MFYIAERHTALATDVRTVVRSCVLCGHQEHARVIAQTLGMAEAPFFTGRRHAAAKAGDRALDALPAEIRRSADLARCPRCNKRRPRAVWRALLDAAIGPVMMSIVWMLTFTLLAALALVSLYTKSVLEDGILPTVLGGGATIIVTTLWIWRGYARRVHWIDTIGVEWPGRTSRSLRAIQ